jgi:OmcA/MtrC family decaheme c-type cytochrome
MNVIKNRALTLLAAVAIAGTACSGDKGPAGAPGTNGANGTYKQALSAGGLQVAVSKTTVNADGTVAVEFTVKDGQGSPVDLAGQYSVNTPIQPRFSLSQVNVAADGTLLPYTVLTKAASKAYTTTAVDPNSLAPLSPTALNPYDYADPKLGGTLVENGTGAGDYTYTFPVGGTYQGAGAGRYLNQTVAQLSSAATVDPKSNSTFVIWIEATRQTNLTNTDDPAGFTAVNVEADFIPSGSGTPVKRQIAATSGCASCHRGFRPSGGTVAKSGFHGNSRVEAAYCDVCHNPARISTATVSDSAVPAATSAIFVHRIHASVEMLQKITSGTSTVGYQGSTACTTKAACTCTVANPCLPNSFHGISDVTYPQDLRNCDACHKGAAQGGQAATTVTRAVCGSCHDFVVFDPTKVTGLPSCIDQATLAPAKDTNGNWLQCAHAAGAQPDDSQCAGCHLPSGAGYIGRDFHAVAIANGTSGATAAVLNDAARLGGSVISYVIQSVSTVNDTTVMPNVLRPQMVFKVQIDGKDAPFNTCGTNSATYQLFNNFVGSPSIYFVWSSTQDGIAKPADFNARANASVAVLCNGNGTFPPLGALSGPDANGFYTATLTYPNSNVPAGAGMLTGAIGYAAMVQTNLPAFPYNASVKPAGGLAVLPQDVSMPASTKDVRRPIVETARCNTCHEQLGINPSFHGGARNDATACAFCHTANQGGSSGWSANAKYFFHSIHAGGFRSIAFPLDAATGTTWADVTFPGRLNDCEACHAPGTYDLSAAASAAAIPSMLLTTVATGSPLTASATTSPYVVAGTTYGYGYASNDITGASATQLSSGTAVEGYKQGNFYCTTASPCTCTSSNKCAPIVKSCSPTAPCPADATTLVISPITAACSACHDSSAAVGHMVANGGQFYAPRSTAAAATAQFDVESCLVCHGTDGVAPIAVVHQ